MSRGLHHPHGQELISMAISRAGYNSFRLRQLTGISKGAKVVCQLVRSSDVQIELSLAEVNGVAVTLSSVDITVRKFNRFAGFISYYIMKVPKGSQAKYSKTIRPVQICGESRNIKLKLQRS